MSEPIPPSVLIIKNEPLTFTAGKLLLWGTVMLLFVLIIISVSKSPAHKMCDLNDIEHNYNNTIVPKFKQLL